MASACLSVWEKTVPQLLPWCQTHQFLPVRHWCLSNCYPSAGTQSKWVWVNPCVDSFRGTAQDSSSLFYWLSPYWFLQSEGMGTYLPGTGTLGYGAWFGARASCSIDILPEYLPTTCGCGNSPFCVYSLSTSLDGYGFFNFVVVRLPFSSISEGADWWLLYILVVILMWLYEEVSCVFLCCHLDQKSPFLYSWLLFPKPHSAFHFYLITHSLGKESR